MLNVLVLHKKYYGIYSAVDKKMRITENGEKEYTNLFYSNLL